MKMMVFHVGHERYALPLTDVLRGASPRAPLRLQAQGLFDSPDYGLAANSPISARSTKEVSPLLDVMLSR